MEVAASIIGTVAFGLQACQGLLTYYRSFKDSTEDVKTMYTSLEGLTRGLSDLERIIKEQTANSTLDPNTASLVQDRMAPCNIALKKLREKLDKVLICDSQGKVKAFRKRLEYPFKESTLCKIKEQAQDARDDLKLSLEILQMSTYSTSSTRLDGMNQRFSTLLATIDTTNIGISKSKIAQWLSPTDHGVQQSGFSNRREPGTGQWLLESPELLAWRDGTVRTLLCPGIPGSGKTFMSSAVIDDLWSKSLSNKVAVTCLYCNYKSRGEQSATAMLASMLKQIIDALETLPQSTEDLYRLHHRRKTRPALGELCSTIVDAITMFDITYLVLDGLDELLDYKTILSAIRSIQQRGTLKVFITSRLVGDITSNVKADCTLEIRAKDADVGAYLDGQLWRLSPTIRNASAELWLMAKKSIIEAIDGMFLLARLHLETFTTMTTVLEIKKALRDLPRGEEALPKAYDSAIDRIESQPHAHIHRAKQIISWILHATRPLTALELQHALAILPEDEELDLENFVDIQEIASFCAGLVVVDSDVVRLVHYTTHQYLQGKHGLWCVNAEASIASTCLTYLSLKTWDRRFSSPSALVNRKYVASIKADATFLAYAAENWVEHLRPVQKTLLEQGIRFLRADNIRVRTSILGIEDLQKQKMWPIEEHLSDSAVHFAAFAGLNVFVSKLSPDRLSLSSRDYAGLTPLACAALSGSKPTVEILLPLSRAEIEEADVSGLTPLFHAMRAGKPEIVQMLIDAGANIHHQSPFHGDVVQMVCKVRPTNDFDILKILLQNQGYSGSKDSQIGRTTALSLAARSQRIDLVRLLLEYTEKHSVEELTTALFAAISRNHTEIARLLITRGIQTEAILPQSGLTLLQSAAELPSICIAELLIENGASTNFRPDHGPSPLYIASERGHEDMVKLLLNKRSNVNGTTGPLGSALQVALWHDEKDTIRILRAAGASDPDDSWKAERAIVADKITRLRGEDISIGASSNHVAVKSPRPRTGGAGRRCYKPQPRDVGGQVH